MKNKKAQMKIQQMTFMLIAVVLFFVLVGLIVIVFQIGGLKESANQLEEKNAMLLVGQLANSPEFSCGEAFGSKNNCVDEDKLMVLKDNQKYADFWQVAGIEIIKIYPNEQDGEVECTAENYPDCNKITIISKDVNKGPYQSTFVSLCRKEILDEKLYDKCEMAKLLVSYEVKE